MLINVTTLLSFLLDLFASVIPEKCAVMIKVDCVEAPSGSHSEIDKYNKYVVGIAKISVDKDASCIITHAYQPCLATKYTYCSTCT